MRRVLRDDLTHTNFQHFLFYCWTRYHFHHHAPLSCRCNWQLEIGIQHGLQCNRDSWIFDNKNALSQFTFTVSTCSGSVNLLDTNLSLSPGRTVPHLHRAVRPLQLKCDKKKNMHFLIAFSTSPVVLEDAGPDCDIPSSERKLIACLSWADNQTFGYCLQPVCCVTVSFAVFTSGTTDYDEFP